MTRLRADLLLLLATFIWGTAFIAQKAGVADLGPLGFVGVRFLLSFLAVLPFAIYEIKTKSLPKQIPIWSIFWLCIAFFAGCAFQHYGLRSTSVTNAGFLTSLYVVMIPFIAWVCLRRPPQKFVWPASVLALIGVFLVNGGKLEPLQTGDALIVACAAAYAFHIVLVTVVLQKVALPLSLAALQYGVCALLALPLPLFWGDITWTAIESSAWPLLYAGLLSGGLAYTLQIIAQQRTPPSDAAVILCGEALFAAMAAAILLGERLTPVAWGGCAMILAAMLFVEIGPLLWQRLAPKIRA